MCSQVQKTVMHNYPSHSLIILWCLFINVLEPRIVGSLTEMTNLSEYNHSGSGTLDHCQDHCSFKGLNEVCVVTLSHRILWNWPLLQDKITHVIFIKLMINSENARFLSLCVFSLTFSVLFTSIQNMKSSVEQLKEKQIIEKNLWNI